MHLIQTMNLIATYFAITIVHIHQIAEKLSQSQLCKLNITQQGGQSKFTGSTHKVSDHYLHHN
jgi:hypothetical protein